MKKTGWTKLKKEVKKARQSRLFYRRRLFLMNYSRVGSCMRFVTLPFRACEQVWCMELALAVTSHIHTVTDPPIRSRLWPRSLPVLCSRGQSARLRLPRRRSNLGCALATGRAHAFPAQLVCCAPRTWQKLKVRMWMPSADSRSRTPGVKTSLEGLAGNLRVSSHSFSASGSLGSCCRFAGGRSAWRERVCLEPQLLMSRFFVVVARVGRALRASLDIDSLESGRAVAAQVQVQPEGQRPSPINASTEYLPRNSHLKFKDLEDVTCSSIQLVASGSLVATGSERISALLRN